jgi:hypothetical protein
MSVAAAGLVVLVGGVSLVLYVLLAGNLAPRANLDQPNVMQIPPTSRSQGEGISGRPHEPQAGGGDRKGGPSSPLPNDLIIAMLDTPAFGTSASGSFSPAAPSSQAPTGSSDPAAPPGPGFGGLPPAVPVPPVAGPPDGGPPAAAAASSNHCGKSRGHRIHVPQGSGASSTSKKAKGHVLHPCKSKGHGGTPDSPPDPAKGSGHTNHGHHHHAGGNSKAHRDHPQPGGGSHDSRPNQDKKAAKPEKRTVRERRVKSKRKAGHKTTASHRHGTHTNNGGGHSSHGKKDKLAEETGHGKQDKPAEETAHGKKDAPGKK